MQENCVKPALVHDGRQGQVRRIGPKGSGAGVVVHVRSLPEVSGNEQFKAQQDGPAQQLPVGAVEAQPVRASASCGNAPAPAAGRKLGVANPGAGEDGPVALTE